jgi:hypothetical protein
LGSCHLAQNVFVLRVPSFSELIRLQSRSLQTDQHSDDIFVSHLIFLQCLTLTHYPRKRPHSHLPHLWQPRTCFPCDFLINAGLLPMIFSPSQHNKYINKHPRLPSLLHSPISNLLLSLAPAPCPLQHNTNPTSYHSNIKPRWPPEESSRNTAASRSHPCTPPDHSSMGRLILTLSSIPCSQCKIQKKPDQYSANRLKDLQKQIIMTKGNKKSFNPKSDPFVACSLCKGGAAVEHECYHCAITYPRTDKYFAKNMLKMRKDEAVSISPTSSLNHRLTVFLRSSAGLARSASRMTHSAAVMRKRATAEATRPSSPM